MNRRYLAAAITTAGLFVLVAMVVRTQINAQTGSTFLGSAEENSAQMIQQGRHTFRFDTFGDQAFWGGQLQLHQAINVLTPREALSLGLKVDSDALSPSTVNAIMH